MSAIHRGPRNSEPETAVARRRHAELDELLDASTTATALLEGGPKHGEVFEGVFIGHTLRYPGDERDGGRYKLEGRHGFAYVYKWQPQQ